MPANKKEIKNYPLDAQQVRKVKRILKAKTETEALEELLRIIIENDIIDRAHERFVKGGGEIVDTMGRLANDP